MAVFLALVLPDRVDPPLGLAMSSARPAKRVVTRAIAG